MRESRAYLSEHQGFSGTWKLSTQSLSSSDGDYFTAQSGEGIAALPIDPALKASFETANPIGKLRPLTIDLTARKQLDDLYTVASYKIARK